MHVHLKGQHITHFITKEQIRDKHVVIQKLLNIVGITEIGRYIYFYYHDVTIYYHYMHSTRRQNVYSNTHMFYNTYIHCIMSKVFICTLYIRIHVNVFGPIYSCCQIIMGLMFLSLFVCCIYVHIPVVLFSASL